MSEDTGSLSSVAVSTVRVSDGGLELALHRLDAHGDGPSLLILHALGEAAPRALPDYAAGWPGPVWALDFAGHGDSPVPAGAGYTAEAMVAEADAALAHLGSATVVGHGLGAYVALLLAGTRTDRVHGVVLMDGPGLDGGGPLPQPPFVDALPPNRKTPDPAALAELARDARPPDYAVSFAMAALDEAVVPRPVVVCAAARPPWLAAVAELPGVVSSPLDAAMANAARDASATAAG